MFSLRSVVRCLAISSLVMSVAIATADDKKIWCSTTPVPEGSAGRLVGDAVKYNEVAARVMRENDVAIDDLYAFAKPQLDAIQLPANVHFSPAGSKVLAKQVAKSITSALEGE
jgi:acyl-CoA thioesterase-1